MTANTALRISELDFTTIKANLKDFLRNQSEFTDFDFEGAGITQILNILAYNTHYMSYYLNMVGNEAFLDTAQLRSSIVSHAKHLQYIPGSMTGATAVVNIRVTPEDVEDQDITTLSLPKFTRFVSTPIDGVNYVFSTTSANSAVKVDSSFLFSNISIKQGQPVTQQYIVSGSRKFVIPSSNVDISTIDVTVQESTSNSFTTAYTRNEDITEVKANSAVYFVEENAEANASYSIYFGDNVIGKKPSNGNVVIVTYLDTKGVYGNKANTFTLLSDINGFSQNVRVTSISAAAGGSDKESIEQIRYRAPGAYTAQNRTVNQNDFESLLLRDYPSIDAISVWSGEDNDPPIYGKVFISLLPKTNYAITLIEKERIKKEIIKNRSVMTVTPEIVDPDLTYIMTSFIINYNPALTNLTENEIKALVRTTVEDYVQDNLRSFKSSFRTSILHRYLGDIGNYIVSSEIDVYLQKRLDIETGVTKNYEVNFGTSLKPGEIGNAMYTYPTVKVADITGVERDVYFEEIAKSSTGVDSIDIINPGLNYTSIPTVTISGDGFGAEAEARIVNGKIAAITIRKRGYGYTRATVAITGGGGTGASATPRVDFKYGEIQSFYYRSSGEKVVVSSTAGTIDYSAGIVYLDGLNAISVADNPLYQPNVLTINIKPERDSIFQKKNTILVVDMNDTTSIQTTLVVDS